MSGMVVKLSFFRNRRIPGRASDGPEFGHQNYHFCARLLKLSKVLGR